jgi:hypothetical protein
LQRGQDGGDPSTQDQPQVLLASHRFGTGGGRLEVAVRRRSDLLSFGHVPKGVQYPFAVALGTHVTELPRESPLPPEKQRNEYEICDAKPSRENDSDHSRPLSTVGLGHRTRRRMCAGYTRCDRS